MSNAGTANMALGPWGTGWVAAGTQFNGATGQMTGGSRRHGLKAKTLKRMLKKAGLKCSGKKATLRARAKKAHLVRGGGVGLGIVGSTEEAAPVTAGRRRRRKSSSTY